MYVMTKKTKYYIWNLIHNCIAHPIMGITFNSSMSEKFHDWTANKMEKYIVAVEYR